MLFELNGTFCLHKGFTFFLSFLVVSKTITTSHAFPPLLVVSLLPPLANKSIYTMTDEKEFYITTTTPTKSDSQLADFCFSNKKMLVLFEIPIICVC